MEPRRNIFRFCDIPIGARFIHKGRVFFKLAKSMGDDEIYRRVTDLNLNQQGQDMLRTLREAAACL